jgi:hypothetical protein
MSRNRLSTLVSLNLITLLLVAGCGTQLQTNYKFDPAVNFTRLHKYTWIEGEQKGTANRRLDGETMPQLIVSAVDRQLAAKGFGKTENAGEADFLVTYISILEYESKSARSQDSAPQWTESRSERYDNPVVPEAYGASSAPQTTSVGTVVIRMLDPKTRAEIWQGTAEAALKPNANPDERIKKFDEAIQRLLVNFPPKPKV